MKFVAPEIQEYADSMSSAPAGYLDELDRETNEKVLYPQMLSGRINGRIQSMISHLIRPKFVLEVGTYTGYSALCFAEGLAEGGKVVTLDVNPEIEEIATRYFKEAGMQDKIQLVIGDAMEYIDSIEEEIDLAFLDADKENYPNYFAKILPKLRKGGLILADNVLWSGKVLDPNEKDKETSGLRKFNELVRDEPTVEQVMLPVRDGITLIRKK